MSDFDTVRDYANHLKSDHTGRDEMDDELEKMFLLNYDDQEAEIKAHTDNAKITLSPDARNTALGAVRLLCANDPEFSIPRDKNESDVKLLDNLEKAASMLWQAASRVRSDPVHYDVALSMILFGEVHLAVTRTADMVAAATTPAAKARAEGIAAVTPYVFDVWDPRTGYPDFDEYGLAAFYREYETTSGKVVDAFGKDAAAQLGNNRYDSVTLCQFWDMSKRYVWLMGRTDPIIEEQHGLPRIPVIVQLGEGSRIFSEPKYWRQPFLYTEWKTGMWERECLMLTNMYTMAFAFGSNPLWVWRRNNEEKDAPLRDFSRPGGLFILDPGESIDPMQRQLIDPSMSELFSLAERKTQESTIYAQTLGEPVGSGNTAYSLVALLHQAGRLPLIVPQKKAAWAIADAVKLALQWIRNDGSKVQVRYGKSYAEIAPKEIPEFFELECNLELALPQDKAQAATIANTISIGDDPLVSKRWTREEILKIGAAGDMQEEIWTEKATDAMVKNYIMDMQNRMDMQKQAQAQAMAQGGAQGQPVGAEQGGPLVYAPQAGEEMQA